jgi:hypothetical protein
MQWMKYVSNGLQPGEWSPTFYFQDDGNAAQDFEYQQPDDPCALRRQKQADELH